MMDQQQQMIPSMAGHPGFMAPGHYPMHQTPSFGQQAPSSVANAGPAFFNPWEPPPPAASPPSDADLQKRIDKLVEYAAKNGPEFEALMKEKQKNNPAYAFLAGGEGQEYYRYKLWTAVNLAPNASTASLQQSQSTGGGQLDAGFGSSVPYYDSQAALSSMAPAGPPYLSHYPVGIPGSGDQFGYHDRIARPFGMDGQIGGPTVGFGGPLPPEVAAELSQVLEGLTGTKEVIKSAKAWFMQRVMYAQPIVEVLKNRVTVLSGEPERQLHVVYLVNDILFNSLQHRPVATELDSVALAFRPTLGFMLATVFHGSSSTEANQERLRKILDFWGAKEVYDQDTINQLEGEMMAGPPPPELAPSMAPTPTPGAFFPGHWPPTDQQPLIPGPMSGPLPGVFMAPGQFSSPVVPSLFPPGAAHFPPPPMQPPPQDTPPEQPPYPLFPPGLIPGMVRKMQIGSGVPYSSISPADIPSQIPPQTVSESYILKRISKFFKDVGEKDPLEGQGDNQEEEEDEREAMEGARIPPPPSLMEVDPETGTLPDGSVASRGGVGTSERAGLGAHDSEEESQYDDVYSSYRKSRSSNYHTSLSVRAAMKYEHA